LLVVFVDEVDELGPVVKADVSFAAARTAWVGCECPEDNEASRCYGALSVGEPPGPEVAESRFDAAGASFRSALLKLRLERQAFSPYSCAFRGPRLGVVWFVAS
jgi:hypothetical protein